MHAADQIDALQVTHFGRQDDDVRRTAPKLVEHGAAKISRGEMVMVYLASANRDPAKWDDPANFDLKRERERQTMN